MTRLFALHLWSRTTGRPMKPFLSKSQTFGLGETIWADKFLGLRDIFGPFISTHFGTVSQFFSLINHYFLKKLSLYIPILNIYLGFGYKGLVFCRCNGWLMENIDRGLTVPKWELLNRPKIPQRPKNLSAQIVCPSPKVWDFDEKRLHCASVVRDHIHL